MIEIIFPTIERWHCINLILKNLELAMKPKDIQILSVISGSDRYADYVEKRLRSVFKVVKIVRKDEEGIEHDVIRKSGFKPKEVGTKLQQVYTTYELALKNIDKDADYYWFIEDDTLFPLDIFRQYKTLLDNLNGDIITGISYYWQSDKYSRNFWDIQTRRVFPKEDCCNENTFGLSKEDMPFQKEGVVRLGASGLGNVLAKKQTVLDWIPQIYARVGSGADVSFFHNAQKKGYVAYGVWHIHLPHITIFEDGGIEIRGRLDKSLIPLVLKNEM